MGDIKSEVFLASPAVAAATAMLGHIATLEEIKALTAPRRAAAKRSGEENCRCQETGGGEKECGSEGEGAAIWSKQAKIVWGNEPMCQLANDQRGCDRGRMMKDKCVDCWLG
jgi:hypothetical protein